jgi:hypothetical protein
MSWADAIPAANRRNPIAQATPTTTFFNLQIITILLQTQTWELIGSGLRKAAAFLVMNRSEHEQA